MSTEQLQCDFCLEVFPLEAVTVSQQGVVCQQCKAHNEAATVLTRPAEDEPPRILTPEEKQVLSSTEIAERELCRRHLIPFVCRFKPDYKVGWVHKVFAAKLERFFQDVVDQKDPRLIIQVPPRHGKSELVSNNFPSWVLGKRPDFEIIMTAHTLSLPLEFSKANRDRMNEERYKVIFPGVQLDPKTTSAERWRTMQKGGVKCAGVGGGIGGFGAHILIIDDPIKDFEDAQSETIRTTVKNWYSSTAEPRLAPGGGVIIVMTRWHDDDLAGAQLQLMKELREEGVPEEEISQWEVISFPAISESDEYLTRDLRLVDAPEPGAVLVRKKEQALHPARYNLSRLKRKRATTAPQIWSALYQQKPVPDSGEFFKKDDFMYYSEAPQLHHYPVLFAWDLAVGEKQRNDYTVGLAGLVVPVGGLNQIYLLDHFRGRVRDREQLEAIVNMYLKYRGNAGSLGIEYGQIFLSIEMRLLAEFKKHGITPSLDRELVPVRDKRVRATPAQGWMQHHRIWFPKHQAWTESMKDEMLRFDVGVHDDHVDALAWMVRMAQKMPLVKNIHELRRNREKTVEEQLRDIYHSQQMGQSTTGYMTA